MARDKWAAFHDNSIQNGALEGFNFYLNALISRDQARSANTKAKLPSRLRSI